MIKKNDLKNLKEFKKDYSLLFNKMSNGFALHKIILDKEGKPCDSLFLEVNPAFEKLTGLKRAEIIGKTALEMLKNLEPYWIDTYSKVALTGKSVRFEHYSQPLGKYYEVNAYSPKKGYFITIFSELENESHIFKRYFEKYLEYASALFLVLDKEGNISLINKKGVELLGYPKEEIIGKNWFMNFLPEEIESETKEYFMKILRGEVTISDYHENPVITKSGVKILRWQNTLLKDANGEVFGILLSAEDLMEKKRIEEQLKYLATIDGLTQIYNKQTGIELLEQGIGTSLITKTPVTVVFIDANGLKLVNDMYGHIEGDEYLKFLARTLSDCVGEAGTVFRFGGDEFILVLPQYDREKAVQLLKKIEDRIEALSSELHKPYKMSISYGLAVFNPEHPVSTDTLLSTADKEMYKMKNSFYKRYRARAEEKLRESEENFRHFLDDSPLGVRIVTAEGETIYANQAILDIYGFNSLEELRTTPVKTRYTPESYVEFKKRYERRQQGDDSPSEYEVNVVRRNGEVRHLLVSRKRQLWNGKKQYQLLYRDITESKKAEAEVLREKALLDQLVETAHESIVLTDNQGTVLRVNNEFVHIFGYEVNEAVGQKIDDLVALPGARKEARAITESVLQGEKVSLETVRRRKDGTLIDVSVIAAPIQFKGKQEAVYAIYRDITKRKKAEEDLQNTNKQLKKMYSLQNVIRKLNQFLLRCDNEDEIYKAVCDTFIEANIIKFVWIGLTEEGTFDVKPVAYAGIEKEYIDSIQAKWDNSLLGNGPVGTAIKTQKPVIIGNIRTDPRYMPWGEEALKRGYLSIISLPLIHESKVIGVLEVYSDKKDAFDKEDVEFLKELTTDIAIGIKSIRLEKNLQKRNEQLGKAMDNIIFIMAKMSESKDPYTAGHQKKVSKLATAIARKMGLSEDRIEALKFASLIHDIGKINIPGEILSKPARLSETEFALIKEHPKTCYNIIKDIDFPWEIASIILQHHERLDGSGYPEGLKDKEILLESKILAVADAVEAMSSRRPYRAALGINKALEEISKNKGKLYDSDVVDACIKLFKKDRFKFE